jgi:hypothetical protein
VGWLSLYIGSEETPSCYISKIGLYTVRVKRLQQIASGKFHWMFHIHNNGDSCNAVSDMAFTDEEVMRYVEDLVAGLGVEKK